MTHRDRAGDRTGHRAGRREAAGPAGHPPSAAAAPLLRRTGRRGFPTPAGGSPARPERRLPKAFGRRPAGLAMPRIAAPCAPGRKPWETVSMGHYQRSLVLDLRILSDHRRVSQREPFRRVSPNVLPVGHEASADPGGHGQVSSVQFSSGDDPLGTPKLTWINEPRETFVNIRTSRSVT